MTHSSGGKRETLCIPDVDGLKYTVLERKGDKFKLTGRNTITGALTIQILTAEELKDVGYEYTEVNDQNTSLPESSITPKEILLAKTKVTASKIRDVFLEMRKTHPFEMYINISDNDKGRTIIAQYLGDGSHAIELFDTYLKPALHEIGFNFLRRPVAEYFTYKHNRERTYFAVFTSNLLPNGQDTIFEETMKQRVDTFSAQVTAKFFEMKSQQPFAKICNINEDGAMSQAIKGFHLYANEAIQQRLEQKLKEKLQGNELLIYDSIYKNRSNKIAYEDNYKQPIRVSFAKHDLIAEKERTIRAEKISAFLENLYTQKAQTEHNGVTILDVSKDTSEFQKFKSFFIGADAGTINTINRQVTSLLQKKGYTIRVDHHPEHADTIYIEQCIVSTQL